MMPADSTASEARCFPIRLPRPLWIGVAVCIAILVAIGLRVGVPIYRRQVAIRQIERVGGHIATTDGGPDWLRKLVGDSRMALFDEVTGVDLGDAAATNSLLGALSALDRLTTLSLNGANITPGGLGQLNACRNLRLLTLRGTDFTSTGLNELERLAIVIVHGFKIADRDIGLLKEVPDLTAITIRPVDGFNAIWSGWFLLESLRIPSNLDRYVAECLGERIGEFENPLVVTLEGRATGLDKAGLSGLKGVRAISLFDTTLTDRGIGELKDLPGLEAVLLHQIRISQVGLHGLASCRNLRMVEISGPGADACGLAELGALSKLTTLRLRVHNFTGGILEQVGNLDDLTLLDLRSTPTCDDYLEGLKSHKKLRHLDLSSTRVTDAGLAHLKGMRNLRCLRLAGTRVTESGVSDLLRALPDLQVEK